MNGPHIVYAWAFGAVLALCDGLVYAELGAALPGSGGPYVYLREAYRPFGLGRLMAFIFIFQLMLVAPLSIAGGAVGFADYLGFYWTTMTPLEHNLVAAAVCAAVTMLLYRDIRSVGRLAVVMLIVVLATVGWVIVAGLFRFSWQQAFDFPPEARRIDAGLLRAMGAAGLLAMYNYGGYSNVCNIGEELRSPERTLPRAIVLSIVIVVVLYVVMSTVILGMIPWQEAQRSRTIASLFIARTFSDPAAGRIAAMVMTSLILFVTASSLYAVILGYSRIPFAAARDGQFFSVFGRLHPTKHFPHVSLLTIGIVTLPFCFFTLGQLVNWLLQVQILLQFVWQCAAVILLRRYRPDVAKPFKMWLYPLPALVSLAMWIYIFLSAPAAGIAFSVVFLALALGAFAIFDRATAATSPS
jgi:amino acid transporter